MLRWDCVGSDDDGAAAAAAVVDTGLLLSVFSLGFSTTSPVTVLLGELVAAGTGGVVVGIDAPDAVDSGAGDDGICTGDAGDAGA